MAGRAEAPDTAECHYLAGHARLHQPGAGNQRKRIGDRTGGR